jgi:iron complex transport system substrate-binding protein
MGMDKPSYNSGGERKEKMASNKVIAVALVLIIIFGVVGVVVWQQLGTSQGNSGIISVVDDAGNNVTITSYPDKIVSLAPSTTEILFDLGLSHKVVGTVGYSGYATDIQNAIEDQNITVVGTFSKVNVELVTGLQPDLIVASGAYQQSLAQKFTEQGKTVVILNPTEFSGILADITLLGKVTGQNANATALVDSMQSKVDEITAKTSGLDKPGVYVEYYVDKNGYSSYGANSYINELIAMAGGVNVFAGFQGQYVTTSTEEVLKANPQIIIISKGVMSSLSGIIPDSIRARESWNNIDAVKNNKIYEVNEALITIWGPRIVDGLEELAQIIHPEVFSITPDS